MHNDLTDIFGSHFDFIHHREAASVVVQMVDDATVYHNLDHALTVSRLGWLFSNNPVVGVAGLFHDSDHTRMAAQPDYVNLRHALQVWRGFVTTLPAEVADLLDNEVQELILATNSASTPTANYSHDALAIFDADTLAGVVAQNRLGLEAFMDALRGEGNTHISPAADFVKFRGLFTDEAKQWFREHTGEVIE